MDIQLAHTYTHIHTHMGLAVPISCCGSHSYEMLTCPECTQLQHTEQFKEATYTGELD